MPQQKPLIEDRLIDDKELCRILGWGDTTPNVLRARGTLPFGYVKLKKRIRYRLSVVEAYIEQQTVRTRTAVDKA